jgi:polyisoprenoid-binding protein YceI
MKKISTALLGAALLAATTIASAEPATYTIDPNHTSVVFEAKHFGTSTIRARLPGKSGTITIDPTAKTGRANIVVDVSAINSGIPTFDERLKKADLFNAERFPEATFVASDFRFDGDRVTQVSGNLTILGNTNPVTLDATGYNCYQSPMLKKQVCGGDFETTIKRSQWNINYGTPFIPDDIRLLIQIEASHG